MSLITWARGAYIAGIALSVLLFLPQVWFPLLVGKVALAALFFLAAAVLWGFSVLREHESLPKAVWLVGLLPAVYLLSWLFSADKALGLVGTGIDTDTVLFTTLAFVAAALGAALFRTARSGAMVLRALFVTFFLAMLFQCVVVLFGLPGPFADRSVNLIGKWNDFGVMLALLGFLLLVELEFGQLSSRMRAAGIAAGAVLLVLLATVNFSLAWGIVLACAVVVAVGARVAGRQPWISGIVALAAIVFLVFGATFNAQLAKLLPVSSLEVRPSLQSTFEVISAAHGASVKSAALGTGPNTFGLSWLMHKPTGVNQSAFWNLDFNVGFSTLATAFGTTGLLGALAWLLPALLVLAGLWRTRRLGGEERLVSWSLAGAALVLWTVMMLYVPSPSLLLTAFALAGIAIGMLWRGSAVSARPFVLAGTALLVLLAVWGGLASVRRLSAAALTNQAAVTLQGSDLDAGRATLVRAQSIEHTPDNLRLAIDAGNAKLQQLASASSTPDSQAEFKSVLDQTIAAAQTAISADSNDYRPYLSLAQVYGFLAVNKVPGAYENARAAFAAAAAHSPSNPSIPLALARLEAATGSSTEAIQDALKQALTLKPDYTDAILFVVQLDIAQNDLVSAIRDTQTAVQTAPGVPALWFQLGLLYYANSNTKDAIPALEQALKLEPQYANAQYYLGLSYSAEDRTQDALAVFSQLAQSNPDNAEVKAVLANLQQGKPALFGIASSTPPTSRTTAPVQ